MSDEALVKEYAKSRNENCIGVLFERYKVSVMGVSMKYLKNTEEASDATMYIFERLLHRLPDYEVKNFRSWLHTMTRNECLSRLKKKSKSTELHHKWMDDEKKSEEFMENDGLIRLTSELVAKHRSAALANALEQLSEQQKTCVEAFYLMEMSYKQVAEKYGYPISKVKSYIQNGKRKLDKELRDKVSLINDQ